MGKRTVREFTVSYNIWPVVEAWAHESRYELKESRQSTRLYQSRAFRGCSFLTGGVMIAPVKLEVTQTSGKVCLKAWVQTGFLHRLSAFFLIPGEMGIESGGVRLTEARRSGRNAINKLLEQLGQPLVK